MVDHVQLRHRPHERWVAVPHWNVAGDGVVVGLAFVEGAGVRELDPVGSLGSSPSSMAMKSILSEPCTEAARGNAAMRFCWEMLCDWALLERLAEELRVGWLLPVSLCDGVLVWAPCNVRWPCPWGARAPRTVAECPLAAWGPRHPSWHRAWWRVEKVALSPR